MDAQFSELLKAVRQELSNVPDEEIPAKLFEIELLFLDSEFFEGNEPEILVEFRGDTPTPADMVSSQFEGESKAQLAERYALLALLIIQKTEAAKSEDQMRLYLNATQALNLAIHQREEAEKENEKIKRRLRAVEREKGRKTNRLLNVKRHENSNHLRERAIELYPSIVNDCRLKGGRVTYKEVAANILQALDGENRRPPRNETEMATALINDEGQPYVPIVTDLDTVLGWIRDARKEGRLVPL